MDTLKIERELQQELDAIVVLMDDIKDTQDTKLKRDMKRAVYKMIIDSRDKCFLIRDTTTQIEDLSTRLAIAENM